MGWTGVAVGVGIVFLVLGALGIVAGLSVALVGPAVVDDEQDQQDEGSQLMGLGGEGEGDDGAAGDRQEVRAAGAVVAGIGAGVTLLGGLVYAIGRGVESSRATAG